MSKKDESTRRPLSLKAKGAAEATEAQAPRIEERLHKVSRLAFFCNLCKVPICVEAATALEGLRT